MKKKVIKKVKSVKPEVTSEVTSSAEYLNEESVEPKIYKIDKLEIDLGRGDLNQLKDKINEVIEKYGN